VTAYLIAAAVLIGAVAPCVLVCSLATPLDGLVALELAGALSTLALLCLAEGFHRGSYFGVAIVCAVLSWIGGLVMARFLGKAREP
jgi:multisubunit Na+/H+ antiporter MnhF subunit